MPADNPLPLGRVYPAAGSARPDLDTRAEALFTAARKRHDDEIRADERRKIGERLEEILTMPTHPGPESPPRTGRRAAGEVVSEVLASVAPRVVALEPVFIDEREKRTCSRCGATQDRRIVLKDATRHGRAGW